MRAISENSRTTRALCVAVFAAAGVCSVLVTLYFGKNDLTQNSIVSAPAVVAAAVFGPGLWTGAKTGGLTSNQTDAEQEDVGRVAVPGGLEVTENKELIVNPALLDVINYFLLEQGEANPSNALTSHLQSKLPTRAFQEASKIVAQYQAYMAAHDTLLAAQNFGAQGRSMQFPDVSRIASWREQRDRLRRNMLGDKVTEVWYQNGDAQLKQLLGELQQKRDGAGEAQDQPSSLPDSGPRPPIAQHWSSVADEVRHNPYMQDVIARATTSFSIQANQRRQWAVSYAKFAEAVRQVNQNNQHSVLDPFEKKRQIQELLKRFFRVESERQFALHRWESQNGLNNQ